MSTKDTGVCCPCAQLLRGWISQTQGHCVANQCSSSEINFVIQFYFSELLSSEKYFFGGNITGVFFSSFLLCVGGSLSLWGMTCLGVEGSSCALDLVCVVLPCPAIGSRLLAAACAGGLQHRHNPSMVSYGELSAMPSHAYCYPTRLCDRIRLLSGQCAISLHFEDFNWLLNNVRSWRLRGEMICGLYEIWKKQPFYPTLIPVAISRVLSCLFVHYLCIIRQTIIPLCFASVVQMLTGNESPQRLVKE